MTTLTAFIPGVPAPQGSKTAVMSGRRAVLIEASKATAPWRATVTAHARQAMTEHLDKLLRAVLDGVTDAGAWRDDSQVAQLSAVKRWADAETPGGGVHLTISELHDRTEVAS